MTLTILPWYTGIILAMAEFFGMHHVNHQPVLFLSDMLTINQDRHPRASQQNYIHRQCKPKPLFRRHNRRFHDLGCILLDYPTSSPYVEFLILTRRGLNCTNIETQSHAFTHLSFAIVIGLCAYNFFRAITLDPGTCPKPTSDGELKTVRMHIVYLLSDGI